MTPELWIAFVGIAITIIGSTATGIGYLVHRETTHAVSDALLADAVNGFTSELAEFKEVVKHMDGRLNLHETEIALIKQRQDAA